MDKMKVIPVVLLVIILGVGFVAYSFYTQNTQLSENNQELKQINSSLQEENNALQQRYQRVNQENKQLNQRLSTIDKELSQIEQERDDLKERYQKAAKGKDQLAEKLKEKPQSVRSVDKKPSPPSSKDDNYWADFVQKKAELEAKVDDLKSEILNTQSQLAKLQKENKELSLKMDEVEKVKEKLEQGIKTKQRALRVMSVDLVAEREERGQAVKEVRKLRDENISLKRELILANRQKGNLQDKLKEILERKNILKSKLADAENILQDKSLAFKELQSDLTQTIREGKEAVAEESGSVELPPIVVKPSSAGLKGLKGEIIAVNLQEQFVVFDLGESSGISPGVLLKVMRGDREIATLEVIETRKNISAADIKDIVGSFDIQEGDIVISR
jgi:chromosome segregation ATPase